MKKARRLLGNALAGSMDFGIGALLAALTSLLLHTSLPLWYILVGGTLGLLPDADIVWPIARQFLTGQKVNGDHHETLLHRPILVVPAAAVIAYIAAGPYWALTACLCLLWHYLHDTQGLGGGGIAWLWPYSNDYWSLKGFSKPATLIEHDAWIENNWMRLSPLLVREVGIGLASLALALFIASRA